MTASIRQEWPGTWSATSATTTSSGAATSSCLVGSTIAVWVVWSNGAGTQPTSVVDSASQTYTYSGTTVFNNNTSLNVALYYLKNNASATQLNVTATWASAQTYLGIWPAEIQGVTANPFQGAGGQSQDSPGSSVGAISSGNVTPTSQPALLYAICMDSRGGAVSTVAGSLNTGVAGWLLSGNTASSGLSANLRLTSTSAIASTFTNATDATASFLTVSSVWTEAATNNAVIAWVV